MALIPSGIPRDAGMDRPRHRVDRLEQLTPGVIL